MKPNQVITLINNETGERRTGRVQAYSADIITLTMQLNAKKWHAEGEDTEAKRNET